MKYLLQLPVLLLSLAMMNCTGCSGSSTPSNTTAVETCYNVQVTYSGVNKTENICTTRENGGYNGLGVNRFLRFSLATPSNVSIRVSRTSGLSPADPDIYLFRKGVPINIAESTNVNVELLTVNNLAAGDYVAEVSEYVYQLSTDKTAFFKDRLVWNSKSREFVSQAVSNCTGLPVAVSGVVEFDRVPHSGVSLNYAAKTKLPAQEVIVEVICNGGTYGATDITDAGGHYDLTFPGGDSSFIRVRAQMKLSATESWDFSVVDNTNSQYLYVLDGTPFVASAPQTKNLYAESVWNSTSKSYTKHFAAPFAILDSVRKAKDIVVTAGATTFPALKINWSVNNSTATGNLATGRIGSSFFNGEEIYLLGKEDNDTDEYDEHVIIHEWGHYFEAKFSRLDSIGGSHSSADILDVRVAFSEGFGNAFSSIVTGEELYIDTQGYAQAAGFTIDMENNNCSNAGWFSECSVQSVLYDIYDVTNETGDNLNLDFSTMYDVFINEQKNSVALTSVFSFITPFKLRNTASASAVDALTSAQNIDPIEDIYGDSEISNNPGSTNQLPVFRAF